MSSPSDGLRNTEAHAKTRLLLELWDLGGAKTDVSQRELMQRVVRSGEHVADYKPILADLEQAGAIAYVEQSITLTTPQGLQLLDQGLTSPDFEFDSQIGARTANALLKWIRHQGAIAPSLAPASPETLRITSASEFKSVALAIYDRLNRAYGLDHLVPIYRIRREVGDRVARYEFDAWMLDLQEHGVLELLHTDDLTDITADRAQDSIIVSVGGLLYYVRRCLSVSDEFV